MVGGNDLMTATAEKCPECQARQREIDRLRSENEALGKELIRQANKVLKMRRALEDECQSLSH
jgi:hypothetical protein